ncbi:hypothetical protein [Actinomadura sp. 3N407]|uniref:hypothetical protein n=1 Tax=Actinomadura sp. 3N407 TaxID=3457423 RepID=UPI003FCD8625
MRALAELGWEKRNDLLQGVRENGWSIAGQVKFEDRPEFDFADEQERNKHGTVLGEKANFSNLVIAYGHPAMYDLYRLLCSYTHPSVRSAELYVEAIADAGKKRVAVRDVPERRSYADVIWGVVVLLQAGNLMDRVLAGEPLRRDVGRAALELGVPKEYFIVLPNRSGRRRRRQRRGQR